MYAVVPSRPLGFFGCDVDKSKYPTARIHPGRQNMWVIVKRSGASGIVDDVVKRWLEPVDTSGWYAPSNAQFAIVQQDEEGTRFYVSRSERLVEQSARTFSNPPVLGSNPQFYVVLFNAPSDAPSEIPWPVEGCPEEADWVLLWTTSSKPVATSPTPSSPVEEGQEAAEARRKAAEQALLEASNFGAPESSSKLWLFIGAAAVAGAGYFALRRVRGLRLKSAPSR